MAYNMKGFGGFKSSPAQLKQNYEKGFKNMSDLQLKNVIKRQKARGNSRKTAFESIKDAETSIDSLQTAQKELNRRKLDKMDPSGRIRKSTLLPKKRSVAKADKKLIDIAANVGKKGNEMLKKMFDIPVTRAYNKLKKTKDVYKKIKLSKKPKIKYPKVAKAIKKPTSSTDLYFDKLRKDLNITKQDKTRTLKKLNFQPTELGQMRASIKKNK